jgi:hypothetical protein
LGDGKKFGRSSYNFASSKGLCYAVKKKKEYIRIHSKVLRDSELYLTNDLVCACVNTTNHANVPCKLQPSKIEEAVHSGMENLTHGNEGYRGIFRKHISVHFLNK